MRREKDVSTGTTERPETNFNPPQNDPSHFYLLELGVGDSGGHTDLKHLARLQDTQALQLIHHITESQKAESTGQQAPGRTGRGGLSG